MPVVVCHHGTGGSKDSPVMRDLLYRVTKMNMIGVSMDARYHGERLKQRPSPASYSEAIIRAWQNTDPKKQEHPFYYDTAYDIWRLLDYLTSRPDIDANRIGMMGISMGGIETYLAAAVDMRIKVVVPAIAAQSFKWSLQNDRWQGRVGTIRAAHEQAAKDLGDAEVNKQNIKKVWDKIVPGITDKFDCPSMIRLIAPRPLLILSTEKDQNCPLPGAEIAFQSAKEAFQSTNALDKLKIEVAPNEPHRFTPQHSDMMLEWFRKWL